jgi:flagellar M-ring protein FliF
MRENLTQILARYRRTFSEFTAGQKAVAIVGTAALLLAAFLVFRWVASPSYSPLYTNLSSSDASSVIDELNSEGVSYKLADSGSTILVPAKKVYPTRIALAGKNLPAGNGSSDGYSLLDKESLSTSDFKEQTDFKRAMEGELDSTLEAMTGVKTAIVHLAMPEKQVFSDEQDPTTASVLLELEPGTSLTDQQVQAIVHLVAAAIDGLDPADVTVTDANGNLLNSPSSATDTSGLASTQAQATQAIEDKLQSQVQSILNTVVGPGNGTADVTADLNFDDVTTYTHNYTQGPNNPVDSASSASVQISGAGLGVGVGGVVGPDGGFEPGAGTGPTGDVSLNAQQGSQHAQVGETIQNVKQAPGSINSIHVAVVVDSAAIAGGTSTDADGNTVNTAPIQPAEIQRTITAALGIKKARGDTIRVTAMPFNHDAEEAAAKELAQAKADADHDARMRLYRDVALGTVVAMMVLLAWIKARRRSKAREQATTYVVEQLRADAAARAAELEATNPALEALEAAQEAERAEEEKHRESLRDEIAAFAQSNSEDMASLIRGWLTESA